MFDHVQIKVADLARSRAFYAPCMEALGYGVVFETDGVMVGFGVDEHNMLVILQASAEALLSQHVHLALKAKDIDDVRAFYDAALCHGGVGNGAPGLRPQYGPHYYAAFVLDPDGHNIEAVSAQKDV